MPSTAIVSKAAMASAFALIATWSFSHPVPEPGARVADTTSSGPAVGAAPYRPAAPVGIATDPAGGTWTVTSTGAVTATGGAVSFGDLAGVSLNQPIVAMAATPDGRGYWLVASDGGVFSFGDAAFHGSTGAVHLARPVVGMAATPDGRGYWLVASDGGVFSFGDAPFYGSASGLGRTVTAASSDGAGYQMISSAGQLSVFAPSQEVASVSLTSASGGTEAYLSWSYTAGYSPLRSAAVELYERTPSGYRLVGADHCSAGCSSYTFFYLDPGATYVAAVADTSSGQPGAFFSSPSLTVPASCRPAVCVSVDTSNVIGPATRAAQGILHGEYPGADQAWLAGLDSTMYRGSVPYGPDGQLDWSRWQVALAAGVPTTLIVSDAWWAANDGNPPAPTPAELAGYRQWLTGYIRAVLASGNRVDYFEPVNEPGLGYYSPPVAPSVTAAEIEQQFLVSYQVVKGLDPAAKVIGPSVAGWSDSLAPSSSGPLDAGQFLRFAAANGVQLAAVSFHSNGTLPLALANDVADARRLIAALPSLGDPEIFVNEYGNESTQRSPGWDVANLQAVTDTGVSAAGRSCWVNDCWQPDLDGLLSADGTGAFPVYFERVFYASMTGSMAATTSSDDSVTSVASYDPTTSRVKVLAGRGSGCEDSSRCGTGQPGPAGPVEVKLELKLPWPSATVAVTGTDFSGSAPAATSAPAPSLRETVTTSAAGTATVTVPAFADGDAWGVTLTRAG